MLVKRTIQEIRSNQNEAKKLAEANPTLLHELKKLSDCDVKAGVLLELYHMSNV